MVILTGHYIHSTYSIVEDQSIKGDLSPQKKNAPANAIPVSRQYQFTA